MSCPTCGGLVCAASGPARQPEEEKAARDLEREKAARDLERSGVVAGGPVAGSVVTIRPGGISVGVTQGTKPRQVDSKRGVIRGWSRKSAARHTQRLQAIDAAQLDGVGYGITLTVYDMPATGEEWSQARREILAELREVFGSIRDHWVIEWQRRGVPHLHITGYFAQELAVVTQARIVEAWVRIARDHGWYASRRAQYVKAIYDEGGWSKYTAKHSARSAAHYQRVGMPPGWEKTGRMWGFNGDWPSRELKLFLNGRATSVLRRLLQGWAKAEAVTQHRNGKVEHTRSIRFTAGMLQGEKSRVRGVGVWLGEESALKALNYVSRLDGAVVQEWAEWVPERVKDAAAERDMIRHRMGAEWRGWGDSEGVADYLRSQRLRAAYS